MSPALHLDRWLLDDDPADWAAGFVRKLAEGRPVPDYGSKEWRAAPWELQVASAVRAGEAWRREQMFLPAALADELAAVAYLGDVREAEEFAAVAEKVRSLATAPTHVELVERRSA